jgi:chromosome segregation ATPase
MFHAILCTSIAVLGLGADDTPHERIGSDPAPKSDAQEKAATEQRISVLQDVVADLNRQLAEAKKIIQDLKDENKIVEVTLDNERQAVRKRLIALDAAAKTAVAQKDASEVKIHAVETLERELAAKLKETNKNLAVMQTQIDGMRGDIKLAVDERNRAQKKLVDANDSLMNAVAELQRLQKLGEQLATEIIKIKQHAGEERNSIQKKLAEKTAEADARKALFDRLAKAVREKRFDDALKLVEEDAKANETRKTDRPTP